MQCNKTYAWENLDAILYERTFQGNLRLDRVFTITNTKKRYEEYRDLYAQQKNYFFSTSKIKNKNKKDTTTTNKQKTKENQMKKVHNG